MSENIREELKLLKSNLNKYTVESAEYVETVKQYNNLLNLLMVALKKPLPEEIEIDKDIILKEYLEFKEEYIKKGPYTIHKLIRDSNVIALVKVRSVKSKGRWVILDPIEVYKGNLLKNSKIEAQQSWMPDPWFRKGEKCLVFLLGSDVEGFFALGLISRMPLVFNESQVECWDCDFEFWPGFEVKLFKKDIIHVNWTQVKEFLHGASGT